MSLLDDIFDAIGDLVDAVTGKVPSGFTAAPGAADRPSSFSAAPQQFGAAKTVPVNVTVLAPKARISWDKEEWRESQLEELFDSGEVLGFDLVNDITMKRKSDCWDTPHGNSWALTLPQAIYAVPIPDDGTKVAVEAINTAGTEASKAANEKIAQKAVKKATVPGGYEWSGKRSQKVMLNLLPGRYLIVAEVQTWVSRKWDCPHGWWGWQKTGPRVRSMDYMREHCTEKCTKFYRKVYVARVKDYSVVVQVPGSGSVDVELQPVAQLFVGNRNVYETNRSRANYGWCKVRSYLWKLIVEKLTGGG